MEPLSPDPFPQDPSPDDLAPDGAAPDDADAVPGRARRTHAPRGAQGPRRTHGSAKSPNEHAGAEEDERPTQTPERDGSLGEDGELEEDGEPERVVFEIELDDLTDSDAATLEEWLLRSETRLLPDEVPQVFPNEREQGDVESPAAQSEHDQDVVSEPEILQLESGIRTPIPKDLHSVYEGGPFRACTACRQPLSRVGLYEIQKAWRGSEVVFETAICHPCGEKLAREVSSESLEAMKGFLLCRFRPALEVCHCHFCGMPRPLFRNFTVVGVCRHSSLLLPRIVMCEKCSESLNDCLSQKTRDVQGDFVQDHFPGIPADFDLSPSFGGLF